MSLLSKAKGLTKKLETIVNNPESLEALAYGVYHYKNPNETIEGLAKERAKECVKCEHLEFDDFDAVKDERIPEISGKMCGLCFCSSPYALRSTKKECQLNKWK